MTTLSVDTAGGSGVYASLALAIASLNGTTLTEPYVITCAATTGVADTTAVNITGITTDATNNLTIQVASGQEHGGYWNTSVYHMDCEYFGIQVNCDYVHLEGLQIDAGGSGANYHNCVTLYAYDYTTANGLLMKNVNAHGVICNNPGVGRVFSNCVADGGSGGFYAYGSGYGTTGAFYLYNCTVTNCTQGIYGLDYHATIVVNCLCVSNTTDFAGTLTTTGCDYNLSSDATAPGSNSIQNGSVTFQSGTYMPTTGDDAISAGLYLTAVPTDLAGVAHPNPPTIGAVEYVVSSGGGYVAKVWTGSAWVDADVFYWDGDSWEVAEVNVYDSGW